MTGLTVLVAMRPAITSAQPSTASAQPSTASAQPSTATAQPSTANADQRALAATATDVAAIRAARERSNRAIASHDLAGVVAEMMPDVYVVSSAGLQMSGRALNRARFADQFVGKPDIVYRRTPDSVAVFARWGMAAEYGRWIGSWTDPDGKVRIGGSYFAKWQKTGATWRIQAETYVPLNCDGGAYCRTRPNIPGLGADSGVRGR